MNPISSVERYSGSTLYSCSRWPYGVVAIDHTLDPFLYDTDDSVNVLVSYERDCSLLVMMCWHRDKRHPSIVGEWKVMMGTDK